MPRIQPFSAGRKDLAYLRDLANLGKHVGLVVQTKQSQPAKRLKETNGAFIVYTEGTEFHAKTVLGVPIDPSKHVPVQGVEDIEWVWTSVEGYSIIDPLIFCKMLSLDLRRYIAELLAEIQNVPLTCP